MYNQEIAMAEGWIMADDAERGVEIQRYDLAGIFADDEAAHNHVLRVANAGSLMHKFVIESIGRHAKEIEYDVQIVAFVKATASVYYCARSLEEARQGVLDNVDDLDIAWQVVETMPDYTVNVTKIVAVETLPEPSQKRVNRSA